MGRLWVWGEGDVVELAKAKPLAVNRHAKVAEINGLPGSLGDLVGGGSRGFALRRQIRHDDSADVRQHHRGGGGEKGAAAFVAGTSKKKQKQISQSQREEEIREDGKGASKQKGEKAKMEKAHNSFQQVLLFTPASSSPPCYN